MALVNITNIMIENNPAPFQSPIIFNITFECLRDIDEEIEWKLIYIGSAKDEKYDQVLDEFEMGPLGEGTMQFKLESTYPDYTKIPTKEDLLGITAIILAVSYKKNEFFRVGYYVYNNYTSPEYIENDPEEIVISDIQRSILADKPRITRFPINWSGQDQQNDQKQDNQTFMFGGGENSQFASQQGFYQNQQNSNNEKSNPIQYKQDEFAINQVFQN